MLEDEMVKTNKKNVKLKEIAIKGTRIKSIRKKLEDEVIKKTSILKYVK
jgi:predicted transcriptional regulator